MFEFVPVSKRVQEMRETYRTCEREVCIWRYKLITEFYQKNYALRPIIRRAKAIEYMLENIPVRIDKWDIVCGATTDKFAAGILHPEFCMDWLPGEIQDYSICTRDVDPYKISAEDRQYILDTADFWKGRTMAEMCTAALPEGYLDHVGNGVMSYGTIGRASLPIGHFAPNFEKAIKVGFKAVQEDARAKVANLEESAIQGDNINKYYFYQAVDIVCGAMITFAKRYAKKAAEMAETEKDEARKKELLMMADSLGRIIENPCESYYDALECILLYQIALTLEGNLNGLTLGRIDQHLNEFYERDIASGKITPEYAQEMLDCFFLKIAEINKVSSAPNSEYYPGYTSGQLMTIGGVKKDGTDASNAVSYMVLQSAGRLLLHDPPVSIRVHKGTPEKLMEAAIETTKRVGGIPSFQCDEVIIEALIKRGFSREDAFNYSPIGCVEPGGSGNEWSQTGGTGAEPFFILPNALLLAINNGYIMDECTLGMTPLRPEDIERVRGKQVGVATGYLYDMKSFDEVLEAVRAQIEYFAKWQVANNNTVECVERENIPLPLASSMEDGCMESGKDVLWGGAKYNSEGAAGVGLGNIADSLQLIKYLCFDEKKCTTRELYDALKNNWKGYEELQRFIKGSAPHYGNDDEEADKYANWVVKTYSDAFSKLTGARGQKYAAGLWPVATHVFFGKGTGATPDGRNAGETLSDGISPVQQMDTNGPTAVIGSMVKFRHLDVPNGTLLNMKFHPSSISGENGVRKLSQLIRTFFGLGGMQIQLNILSADTLRAAQKDPEEYRDLVVRVAGFSTYFVALHQEAQDELISRTDNTL